MSSLHALIGGIAAVLFAGAALQGRRLDAGDRAARKRHALLGGAALSACARGGDRGLSRCYPDRRPPRASARVSQHGGRDFAPWRDRRFAVSVVTAQALREAAGFAR
jgi:hypothetical protein